MTTAWLTKLESTTRPKRHGQLLAAMSRQAGRGPAGAAKKRPPVCVVDHAEFRGPFDGHGPEPATAFVERTAVLTREAIDRGVVTRLQLSIGGWSCGK